MWISKRLVSLQQSVWMFCWCNWTITPPHPRPVLWTSGLPDAPQLRPQNLRGMTMGTKAFSYGFCLTLLPCTVVLPTEQTPSLGHWISLSIIRSLLWKKHVQQKLGTPHCSAGPRLRKLESRRWQPSCTNLQHSEFLSLVLVGTTQAQSPLAKQQSMSC